MTKRSSDIAKICLQLAQFRKQLRSSIFAPLKVHGLTIEMWLILVTLSNNKQGLTMSGLSDLQDMQLPGVSKNIDKLAARGLLYCLKDPVDQRCVLVLLSDIGAELLIEIGGSFKNVEVPKFSKICVQSLLKG